MGFRNRYEVSWREPKESWEESEFFEFRDRVFEEKAALIEAARNSETRFYNDRVAPVAAAVKSHTRTV